MVNDLNRLEGENCHSVVRIILLDSHFFPISSTTYYGYYNDMQTHVENPEDDHKRVEQNEFLFRYFPCHKCALLYDLCVMAKKSILY